MNDDDDETQFALLLPFVNVTSTGGKFDDDAYVAGYEMGGFGQRCAAARSLNLLPFSVTIRRDNLRQADLIAMHQELVMREDEMDIEIYATETIAEWANITVDWPGTSTIEGPPA